MSKLQRIGLFIISFCLLVDGGSLWAREQPLPLDKQVKVGKLSNGFTYYIRRNMQPKSRAFLFLVVKAGSILEEDNQRGLAHFIEHMGFNGTKHFPKHDLIDYLQRSGVRFGADLNAYTTFDETVYTLSVPTDSMNVFENGIQIMRDWAQDITLDSLEIDRERGVILEEKRLGKGAVQRMQTKYLPVVLDQSRYAQRLPIGTEEVIKNAKPSTLRRFYETWYRPDLEALIVVGDIDVKKVERLVKARFSDLKNPVPEVSRPCYKVTLTGQNQYVAVVDEEWPATVAQILIKHPSLVVKTKANYQESMIRTLYNEMIGSRFLELSQEDSLLISAESNIGNFLAGLDASMSLVAAKPLALQQGFKAIFRETERVRKYGFTQRELTRAKEAVLNAVTSLYEESDKTNSIDYVKEYVEHFLHGESSPGIAYEYRFIASKLGKVTLQEVNAFAVQYLNNKNRDILVMSPAKDSASLPSERVVNEWISDVEKENLVPYIDHASTRPLLEEKPVPGKILTEKKLAKIGLTELILSNGIRVVLKPTNYKNEEIQFVGFSPGGSSSYSDSLYESAANAADIIALSGLGNYNYKELNKFLAPKQTSVTPFMAERIEGIRGSTTPRELETALQLTYLYFTAPRKDTTVFNNTIAKAIASLANRSDDPNKVFADTISAVLGNYSTRRTGPSVKKIMQIHLDTLYGIYKERFANARCFTFIFVGSVDIEKLKPLLERYLGSLPSVPREERAKNLGIHIPEGRILKIVRKGQEAKAEVRLVVSGTYTYSPESNCYLGALAQILKLRLLERLREEARSVYSPSASVDYHKYPESRYAFNMVFSCAPENVDKLVAATWDEVDKIKSRGPEITDISKYCAGVQRLMETQLKQNSFWLSYLSNQYKNEDSPEEVLNYMDLLRKLTPNVLKDAANKYLNEKNYILFVLIPENK